MEKPVANNHSRRHSTGNLMLHLTDTGYENVLSRYLSAPFPSCHDHCKPHSIGPDHPAHTRPTRKRSNKSDVDSVQALKKPFTPIPRSPTRPSKIETTALAKQRQDFRSRSKSTSRSRSKSADTADPFYIPPTRITRRFSDVNLLATSSKDAHVSPSGGGLFSGKKNDKNSDSRTDVKPVNSTVKNSNVKPVNSTVKNSDVKPINSVVKKPDVKPIKSAVKTPDVKPVTSVVKMPENGTNSKVQHLKTVFGSTKPEVERGSKNSKFAHVGEVVQEKRNKSQSQNEERVTQNGAQIASKTEKDETLGTESQSNSSIAASTVKKTQVRRQVKENEEVSSQKLKFKQGKVIDSQSETEGPRRLEFAEGEMLVKEKPDEEEVKSLRRLSSDGELQTPETNNSVSVSLKKCDKKEKKVNTRLNNVIEETAGRLIRTRKSKVQALVGAFEMVSANEF